MTIASRDFRELRLDGVSRGFGALNALKDVTLTIQRGEFITLLGPSGCGKSTALNCVAGLLPLTGGSIWLDDRRLDQLRPEDRGFGMVFQNYALFPHMNVRKNVGFGLAMRNESKADIDRKVEDALNVVRLSAQGGKLPGQLSGGQQQRVAIARAIVIEPPLVLMDEPLSNLDAKLRLEMRAEIRRIHQYLGSATIYVTHDQDEALSLADRIVVLRDGTIRQVGTPAELYSRPAHADVAEFMGYRNIIRTEANPGSNGWVNVGIGGAEIAGTPLEGVQRGRAIAAIRPEDLSPVGNGPIVARVETAEYRGRDFYGTARTEDGTELYFRSEQNAAVGEVLHLGADPARVLVYADTAASRPAELAPNGIAA
ncbi:carbohydrate ABC transporter ATP-binding protein, CUT1 family [Faunimonas pinastri]|uniref:Carbohydrate ABC transporter ATP-binding protein, CUT1 family n=1 Tax=Faunimonas pinastri TaxID=1855383 RepID=A0A1H8ZE83_9HYPH|nr:ABC transporter ATP-binding protein [Faunimonas pinastri]SEP62714.1 carbohydrate ABC transporter ATP-binding protein, CUT1 family [Faunimonas pinastri]